MTPIDFIYYFVKGLAIIICLCAFIGGCLSLFWQLAKFSKSYCEQQGLIAIFALYGFVIFASISFVLLMILIGSAF